MTTTCFVPVLGKRVRVTKLDACGEPYAASTADAMAVTNGFISVALSSEVEDGAEILTRRADGSICVNERQSSTFKRFTAEIEFCGVDAGLLSLVTNAETYDNYAGDPNGIVVPEGTISKNFALELWTGLSGAACQPGAEEASGYLLLPYLRAGVLGDISVDGENAVTFSMTGAYTKGGNGWGVGPYDVLMSGTNAVDEVQTITITGTPTGGTFKLEWPGVGTTATIAYNATAANVATALVALGGVETGDVVGSGGPFPGTAVVLTWGGGYAGTNVPQLVVRESALTGGTDPAVGVVTTTPGAPGGAAPLPTALDPLDHLLLIDTEIAPPASACGLQAMPS